jgi:hypothetical protein
VFIFTSYILFRAPFEGAKPGLQAGDEGFQVTLQSCQFLVVFGHDIFQLLQPKLQEGQFPLPQFFLDPVFQLSEKSLVHITPFIDYSKRANLSIIRQPRAQKISGGQRPTFAVLSFSPVKS